MTAATPRLPSWLPGLSLVLLGLALYLPVLWNYPLSRSEAMYALIPQEMFQAGQWLTPTLNGTRYLDKPPLFYWLNLAAYYLFGVSDRVARLPTLLVGLGEVWFTYLVGRRLLGDRAAWLGGFVLLSSVGFFTLHVQLLTDHLVTLTLVATMYVLLRYEDEPSWRWVALFQGALALGFLSKGLIGLAFPLLILAGYAWFRHQARLLLLALDPRGWLVFLALTVPWLWAMQQTHPGFFQHHLLNEQILRFLGRRYPPDIIPFSLPGFWLFLFIWLLPWSLLLPEGLYRFWRETGNPQGLDRRGRLLILWAAVILVFFSVSLTRIEYYSLPALPPLALILGWRVCRYLKTPRDRSLPLALLFLGLLGLASLMLLPYLEQLCAANRREFYGMFPLIQPIARQVTVWLPLLALAGVVAGWRRPALALTSASVMALVLLFFTWKTLLILSPLLSDKLPGEYLRREAGSQDLIVMEAIEEFEYGSSLALYSGHRILMVQRQGFPQFPMPVSAAENYLITPERLRELWTGPRRVFLLVDNIVPAEPFLENATLLLDMPGKRLISNRPGPTSRRQGENQVCSSSGSRGWRPVPDTSISPDQITPYPTDFFPLEVITDFHPVLLLPKDLIDLPLAHFGDNFIPDTGAFPHVYLVFQHHRGLNVSHQRAIDPAGVALPVLEVDPVALAFFHFDGVPQVGLEKDVVGQTRAVPYIYLVFADAFHGGSPAGGPGQCHRQEYKNHSSGHSVPPLEKLLLPEG